MDSAKLIFINQINDCKDGQKLRFLGCVQSYKNGILRLIDGSSSVTCDVTVVLPDVSIQKHEWLNIVGRKRQDGIVDVLLIRSAVGINLPRYRQMVSERQKCD
ncbi:telomere cap complex subunit Ten1 [Schizosaccharomyces pombe]|uniref:Protein ten1 n=1 Tax=Schizosaccharomyces pombe (strain 972 / ATCC 24843) TaxID=284812 RepID=TEN1_SCHPO|nr:nuclear telomere cap complex subunit Ten1 [Schizosaccharomyces pombe]P0C5Y7.1 RecName: Full=Protein ten1 [Schizosaccharomyces pombe 972h-]3K0X_A Chain A, Protein Ten1 [Schizosaccharomyces pombe]CBA11518.1 nuclear telomere cap complex subunit Ten1 [Schizosaccharomyces pombe]|eukprot:NP_001343093.1 nuclear telomere cap complex subunit Ten1 [Schizosaccharomyces pombe]